MLNTKQGEEFVNASEKRIEVLSKALEESKRNAKQLRKALCKKQEEQEIMQNELATVTCNRDELRSLYDEKTLALQDALLGKDLATLQLTELREKLKDLLL